MKNTAQKLCFFFIIMFLNVILLIGKNMVVTIYS